MPRKRRANHKPSMTELFTGGSSSGGSLKYRKKRTWIDDKGKRHSDDPALSSASGAATVALGLSAIAFASRSIKRTRLESTIIEHLWDCRTSIASIRRAVQLGEPLPDVVLVRGTLKARGAPVTSLAMESKQLQRLVGDIDQPRNFFMDLARKVDSGEVVLPPDFGDVSDIKPLEGEGELLKRKAVLGSNLLLTELFITRLGCEAFRKRTKDKDGKEKIEIERKPRQARFNVLHHRRVADGLHIVGEEGEGADLELPPVLGPEELAKNLDPELFLTLPDALNEFKRLVPGISIINADKPLTHASRFLHLDQRSNTDLGGFIDNTDLGGFIEGKARDEVEARNSGPIVPVVRRGSNSNADDGETALEEIGRIVPNGWTWNGKGFYDNRERGWSTHAGIGVFAFREFRKKMKEAAEENALYQEASLYPTAMMRKMRDSENCFRFAEIGISSGDVTVLGKPVSTRNGIKLVPPKQPKDIDDPRFLFRILQGHSIENLQYHRMAALRVYLGFAVMGVATVFAGEEQIRDSVEVTYT